VEGRWQESGDDHCPHVPDDETQSEGANTSCTNDREVMGHLHRLPNKHSYMKQNNTTVNLKIYKR